MRTLLQAKTKRCNKPGSRRKNQDVRDILKSVKMMNTAGEILLSKHGHQFKNQAWFRGLIKEFVNIRMNLRLEDLLQTKAPTLKRSKHQDWKVLSDLDVLWEMKQQEWIPDELEHQLTEPLKDLGSELFHLYFPELDYDTDEYLLSFIAREICFGNVIMNGNFFILVNCETFAKDYFEVFDRSLEKIPREDTDNLNQFSFTYVMLTKFFTRSPVVYTASKDISFTLQVGFLQFNRFTRLVLSYLQTPLLMMDRIFTVKRLKGLI